MDTKYKKKPASCWVGSKITFVWFLESGGVKTIFGGIDFLYIFNFIYF